VTNPLTSQFNATTESNAAPVRLLRSLSRWVPNGRESGRAREPGQRRGTSSL